MSAQGFVVFFSSRRGHTICGRDWSSDVCSSDLNLYCAIFATTAPSGTTSFSPWFHGSVRPKLVVPEGAVVAKIAQYKFPTDAVRIPAGATVVWVNDDVAEHTVTFDGTEPGSPMISPGGTFSHRFDRPGTYPYHCTPHPFMKGVVVVK